MKKLIKKLMTYIDIRKFKGEKTPNGETIYPEMDKVAILEALERYKVQNPTKYAAKKAELFARYGLNLEDEIEQVPDELDLELAAAKAKAKKSKK